MLHGGREKRGREPKTIWRREPFLRLLSLWMQQNLKEQGECVLCFVFCERESEWCRLYYVFEYVYIGKRCELRL